MSSFHAFDDELAKLDAVDTAAAVRNGELSAKDAVAGAIRRARLIQPVANPVACEDYDRAIAKSLRPKPGAFMGVPTFIKDMTDVEGLPTRNGSNAFAKARPAKKTFGIAAQIFDLGMIGLGKSTLPEFGFTPSTEFPSGPPTRNPWNLDHTAGGSSGGAAALVAGGVVPIAHGQDGGGSIRIPAACAGLVGHKPSRGRLLPDPHSRILPVKIVADGVLTRTVRDTIAYYTAAEELYQPRHMPLLGKVVRPPEQRLRIGALTDTPTGASLDEPTRAAFDSTVALLESLGHTIVSAAPPVDQVFVEDLIHYWAMLAFFTRYGGKLLFDRSFDSSELTPFTIGMADKFKKHVFRTPGAILRLRRSAARYESQIRDLGVDVILSPTLAHLPPALGHLGASVPFDVVFPRVEKWIGFTPLANVTGAPSISLPLGFDEASRLPIGMMFSAPLGHDKILLQLALELEEAKPFMSLADAAPTGVSPIGTSPVEAGLSAGSPDNKVDTGGLQ